MGICAKCGIADGCERVWKDTTAAYTSCVSYTPPPPTNADKIRTSTDEELVDFMIAVGKGYSGCPQLKTCPCDQVTSCMDCWLKWLRREAKDDRDWY